MDERGRRVGRNEAIFREVNEQIESLSRGMAEISDRNIHIVCECADLRCSEQIVVSIDDYERVRSEDTLFLVVPGHEQLDVEQVIEETAAHNIVRKNEGEAARMARELSPR
jgi:hypothetical protein